jgi:hypothetical protein
MAKYWIDVLYHYSEVGVIVKQFITNPCEIRYQIMADPGGREI